MDASAHRRGSPSLNEVLEAGKCMLPKLFDVLVRWRVWKYALISDIKSAFLQIRVDEKDRDSAQSFRIVLGPLDRLASRQSSGFS